MSHIINEQFNSIFNHIPNDIILNTNIDKFKVNSNVDENGNFTVGKTLIFWLLFSLISSAILAKFSRSLCGYLFTTFSWYFIFLLFAQSWNELNIEKDPREIGLLITAGFIGWAIGTYIVWRNRGFSNLFIDHS